MSPVSVEVLSMLSTPLESISLPLPPTDGPERTE
jgi:hypothetical protein